MSEWAARVYASDKISAEICRRMQQTGFMFDRERAAEFASQLRLLEADALKRADEGLGRRIERTKSGGLSTKDLQKAFFQDLRAPVYKRSDLTGLPSLGVDAMRGYAACRSPQLRALSLALLDYRRARKIRSTYIEAIQVGADGRVHPSWLNYGTVGGRWSCQDPNLANLPRAVNDPTAQWGGIRSLYVAKNGSVLVGYDKCLAPESRVLTSDLRWAQIGSLVVGDELIGFDEKLGYAPKMQRSKVVATERLMKPCYRVTTDQGSVICSDNHMWVKRGKYGKGKGSGGSIWCETQDLEIGNRIAYYEKPWETDVSRDGGWFAGFLDGDGWSTEDGWVGFAQNEGSVLNKARDFARGAGYSLAENSEPAGKTNGQGIARTKNFTKVRMRGNAVGIVGRYRPTRLLEDSAKLWEGKRPWGRRTSVATITGIEFLGMREVVAIQTTTRTFIAEGMLSHNSQIEFRIAAYGSGDEAMIAVCEGGDVHGGNAAALFGDAFDRAEYKRLKLGEKEHTNTAAESARFVQLDGLRTVAKSAVFAVCYLAEAKTVHDRIIASGLSNIKLSMVEAMLSAMRRRFHVYYEFQDKRLMAAVRLGYTESPILGRRRWVGHEPSPPEVANFLCQAGAADVMNREIALVEAAVGRHEPRARLVAHVYDSVYFDCPERSAEAVAAICREIACQPISIASSGVELRPVLGIDVDISDRWH